MESAASYCFIARPQHCIGVKLVAAIGQMLYENWGNEWKKFRA